MRLLQRPAARLPAILLWLVLVPLDAAAGAEAARVPESQVLSVEGNRSTIVIAHPSNGSWKIGDQVCVSRNSAELDCGKVIATSDKNAVVALSTQTRGVVRSKKKDGAARARREAPKPGDRVKLTTNLPGATTSTQVDKAGNINITLNVAPEGKGRQLSARPEPTDTPVLEVESVYRRLRRWELATYAGLAIERYAETGHAEYNGTQLRLGVEGRLRLLQRVSGTASARLTALALSKSGSTTARFFGTDAAAEFRFTEPESVWDLSGGLALVYRTMLVDGAAFGIRNLLGPALRWTLTYAYSSRGGVSIGVQYAPFFRSFALSNRDISLVGQWQSTRTDGGGLLIRAWLEGFRYEESPLLAATTQAGIGVGYAW